MVPLVGAGAATAATLDPMGLDTGFEIDGDRTGGTPPGTFDWNSFLTPPVADGSYTFTPTGPYTTADGYASTGILDAKFEWDNGALAGSCSIVGRMRPDRPARRPRLDPWSPGPANASAKGDLCRTASANEVVVDAEGVRHAVLYTYWTRLVGNGSLSVLQLLEGPAPGRCDDVLVVFDYESNLGTVLVHFRRWVPAAGDDCADPNGAGEWGRDGRSGRLRLGGRCPAEGPVLGNQPQATFGEYAVDLTTAGLFSPEECTTFSVSTC